MQAGISADNERRLTLAPLYSPDRVDAHGEFTDAQTLEDAVHAFAKGGNRRLLLQHGDLGATHHVGDILSVFIWPQEATVKMQKPGGGEVVQKFAAGTAWVWVHWDRDAWPLVKSGALGGLSMGGRAMRRKSIIGGPTEHMGYKQISKAGRILSAANIASLRECIQVLEDLIAREPRAVGKAFDLDGDIGLARLGPMDWLVVSKSMQKSFRFRPGEIEVLATGD